MSESTGDTLPANVEVIEVRVSDVRRLFKAIDPSPFLEKDLDADAEEFIVGWAKEARRDARLALLVHVQASAAGPDETRAVHDAVQTFFTRRAGGARRRLRDLLKVGRTSLLIGLAFLASVIAIGDLISWALGGNRLGVVIRESLTIGGWVAMWRPLEVFLYDWWPIRAEARLYDRLADMPVRITYSP